MTITTVLMDNMKSSSHSRHKVEHEGSRIDLVNAIVKLDSKITNIQFWCNMHNQWITASDFILEQSPLPRFVRCVMEDTDSEDNAVAGMLPWRRFGSTTFATGASTDLTVAGYRVRLGKSIVGVEGPHGATGLTLWDGSLYLASFLNQNPQLLTGKRVLELGAGQGVVGVCAALLGASTVFLTDLDYALAGCEDTVAANKETLLSLVPIPEVQVRALDWFNPPLDFELDVILAADVVWVSELVKPLVNTFQALCPEESDTKIILSYQRRGKDADIELWERVSSAGFAVKMLSHQPEDIEHGHGNALLTANQFNISIFMLSRE